MKKVTAVFLVLSALQTFSVFADDGVKGNVKVLEVHAYNWGFNIGDTKIYPGDNVKLVLIIDEGHHGVDIDEFGIHTDRLKKGMTSEFYFTPKKAGKFDIVCNSYCGPGHKDMRNKITVLPQEKK